MTSFCLGVARRARVLAEIAREWVEPLQQNFAFKSANKMSGTTS